MQYKRGTIPNSSRDDIIGELTDKIDQQNKIIEELRKRDSELSSIRELYPIGRAEYDYASDSWMITDACLELLGLELSERPNSLPELLAKLDIPGRQIAIDRLESALRLKEPVSFHFYNRTEKRNTLLALKAKPVIREEKRAFKYFCVLTQIDSFNVTQTFNPNEFLMPETSINNLPMAYFRIDDNYKFEFVNKHWEEYYGYTLEQVKGQTIDCYLPDYAKNEVINTVRKVLNGQIVHQEYSLLSRDNNIKYYSSVLYPVYDSNGNIVGVEGFNNDVTRMKAAEENLLMREERYNIISQNIPVVVYSVEPGESFKVLFISGQIENLTEYDVDIFYSYPDKWKELVYEDDFKYYSKKREEQQLENKHLDIEYRIVTNSGKIKWIRDVSTPLKNVESKTVKINGFVEDISDRKNAERALKLSERKFRSIFEESKDCIYLTTENGGFIDINTAGLNLTGYAKEEILTLNAEHLYVEISDRFRFQRILEKDNYVKDFEFKLRKKNGEIRDCILTSSVSKNDVGEIKGYQGIIRDVTEKKKAEREIIIAKEEAEKADRIKTEFLAQMSHEIRTPINTILSFSSLIRDELSEILSNQAREYFSILDRAGIRIIRTIDLILNMSEIQSGSYNYKLSNIDLAAILLDLYTEYKSHAAAKDLELQLNLDYNDLVIRGDEYSITQIISNLIDNAIKYTEEGFIRIEADKSDTQTQLIIEDSGIGISNKFIPHLFDAFSQEEQGYTRKFEGSGLGLALVKKYCDINKADISVTSLKGNGTRFLLSFKS